MNNKYFKKNYENLTDKKIIATCFLTAYHGFTEKDKSLQFEGWQITRLRHYLEKIEEKPHESIYKRKLSSLIELMGFEKIRTFNSKYAKYLKETNKEDKEDTEGENNLF